MSFLSSIRFVKKSERASGNDDIDDKNEKGEKEHVDEKHHHKHKKHHKHHKHHKDGKHNRVETNDSDSEGDSNNNDRKESKDSKKEKKRSHLDDDDNHSNSDYHKNKRHDHRKNRQEDDFESMKRDMHEMAKELEMKEREEREREQKSNKFKQQLEQQQGNKRTDKYQYQYKYSDDENHSNDDKDDDNRLETRVDEGKKELDINKFRSLIGALKGKKTEDLPNTTTNNDKIGSQADKPTHITTSNAPVFTNKSAAEMFRAKLKNQKSLTVQDKLVPTSAITISTGSAINVLDDNAYEDLAIRRAALLAKAAKLQGVTNSGNDAASSTATDIRLLRARERLGLEDNNDDMDAAFEKHLIKNEANRLGGNRADIEDELWESMEKFHQQHNTDTTTSKKGNNTQQKMQEKEKERQQQQRQAHHDQQEHSLQHRITTTICRCCPTSNKFPREYLISESKYMILLLKSDDFALHDFHFELIPKIHSASFIKVLHLDELMKIERDRYLHSIQSLFMKALNINQMIVTESAIDIQSPYAHTKIDILPVNNPEVFLEAPFYFKEAFDGLHDLSNQHRPIIALSKQRPLHRAAPKSLGYLSCEFYYTSNNKQGVTEDRYDGYCHVIEDASAMNSISGNNNQEDINNFNDNDHEFTEDTTNENNDFYTKMRSAKNDKNVKSSLKKRRQMHEFFCYDILAALLDEDDSRNRMMRIKLQQGESASTNTKLNNKHRFNLVKDAWDQVDWTKYYQDEE